jgi:hypothetical protein
MPQWQRTPGTLQDNELSKKNLITKPVHIPECFKDLSIEEWAENIQFCSSSTESNNRTVLVLEGYWPVLNTELPVYCPRRGNFKYSYTTWTVISNFEIMVSAQINWDAWPIVPCTW